MRNRTRGFSIIELLIALGIIGIIAAIAIVNYWTAIQRARQKRTMADIRGVALAWEARGTEIRGYNAAGFTFPSASISAAQLDLLLMPTYAKTVSHVDGWGHPLEYATDQPVGGSAAAVYSIRAPGADAVFSGTTYTQGPTHSFDCDIVYANGGFVVYPEVK